MFNRLLEELRDKNLQRKLKGYFLLSLILFVFFSIIGYKLAEAPPVGIEDILPFFGRNYHLEFEETNWNTGWVQVLEIFSHNSIAALMTICLGLLFGFGPLLSRSVNGLKLGVVIYKLVSIVKRGYIITSTKILPDGSWEHEVILLSEKTGYLAIIAKLLPHGIVEISTSIFAAALGFYLAEGVFRKIKRRPAYLLNRFKLALFCFVVIILPALFVAATIEVFISGSSLLSPF